MIDNRKTVSDQILDSAKKQGYKKGEEISQQAAAEIALDHSKQLFKEIVLTKKMIEDLKQ